MSQCTHRARVPMMSGQHLGTLGCKVNEYQRNNNNGCSLHWVLNACVYVMWDLLCVWHSSKSHFTYMNSCDLHENSMKDLSPCCSWGNWGMEWWRRGWVQPASEKSEPTPSFHHPIVLCRDAAGMTWCVWHRRVEANAYHAFHKTLYLHVLPPQLSEHGSHATVVNGACLAYLGYTEV